MTELDVKTRLVVDPGTSTQALGGLRNQFEALSGAREATQQGMGFLGQTLSTMAGVYVPQLIGKFEGLAGSLLEAASGGASDDKAMAGLIATMQGLPWDESLAQAQGLGDELDNLAMQTMQSTGDMAEAFQVLNEISGATASGLDASKAQLAQMATLANTLGKSTSAIAREFAFMGEGVLKTKGQMFQILKGTGIFGDNVKKAAGYWASITEEDRARLLAYGLDQISGKLAKATPVYGDLVKELGNMTDIAKEKLGEPLMNALVPELRRLVTWMNAGRGSIEAFANSMVSDVKDWVHAAAKEIQYGWRWVMSHQEDIKNGIVEAWTFAKGVLEFAVKHKDALMIGFGAKAVLGTAGTSVGGAAGGIVSAGKSIYNLGASGGAAGIGIGAGAAGGAAALGAFSLAIAGVGLAAWQGSKLMQQLDDDEKADVRARYKYFEDALESGQSSFEAWSETAQDHFEKTKAGFVRESQLIGLSRKEAEDMANAVRDQHAANRAMVDMAETSANRISALAEQGGGMVDVEEQNQLVAKIVEQYQAALNAGNDGAAKYIAGLVAHSAVLQSAFLDSADMTSAGFKSLAENVKADAGDFSESLSRLGVSAEKRERTLSAAPKVQMNGGQTFKIQQDFRDQDPDRIAFVFQRDLAKAATTRLQANTSSPFGT